MAIILGGRFVNIYLPHICEIDNLAFDGSCTLSDNPSQWTEYAHDLFLTNRKKDETMLRKPIRVLMVNWIYPPEFSGAGLQCHRLAKKLQTHRIQVSVLTSTDQPDRVGTEIFDGIPVIRVLRNKTNKVRHFYYGWKLFNYIMKHQGEFDLIHLHGFISPAALATKLLNLPLIIKVTGMNVDDPDTVSKRTSNQWLMSLYRSAHVVIAPSTELQDRCHHHLSAEQQILRIPNGVDTRVYAPASDQERTRLRETLNWPQQKTIILTVGTVWYLKGIDMLLKAVYRLNQSIRKNVFIAVVGPHLQDRLDSAPESAMLQYNRQIRDMIETFGLQDQIRFEGVKSNLQSYFRACDAYVHPSRSEGQPNALLEAMSCGVASIANNLPGITDEIMQDGQNGFSLDGEDVQTFSSALSMLLNNTLMRNRLGQNARLEVLKKYDLDEIVRLYVELYRNLLSNAAAHDLPIWNSGLSKTLKP